MFLTKPSFLFFLAVVFYLIVSVKSNGYHQEDEHFQIIEFANYKLGLVERDLLAWEYNAKIRPGLQPLMCFFIFKALNVLGIVDGYDLSLFLRVITALVSIFAIRYFIRAFLPLIDIRFHLWFILFSYFLWFSPYINVRFSSETWSGICILIALALQQNGIKYRRLENYMLVAILLGFSILFRYQSGLFVFGVFLWYLLTAKIGIKRTFFFSLIIILILGIGVLADMWLYGIFTLSIYNYFYVNLVQNVASDFGVSPWYSYFLWIFVSPGPLGQLIFYSLILFIYLYSKNVITWGIIPFLIIHSFIPHKELRFLFPLVNLTPLIFFLVYQKLDQQCSHFLAQRKWPNVFKIFAIVVICISNLAGLICVSSTGAGKSQIAVAEFMYRNYDMSKAHVVFLNDVNPYIDFKFLKNTFYNSDSISRTNIYSSDLDKTLRKIHRIDNVNLLIIFDHDSNNLSLKNLIAMKRISLVYQNIPDRIRSIYKLYNPQLNQNCIKVFLIN